LNILYGPPPQLQEVHHRGTSSLLGLAVTRRLFVVLTCVSPVNTNGLLSGISDRNNLILRGVFECPNLNIPS